VEKLAWPAVVVVIAVFFGLLLKKELRNLLGSVRHFKHRNTEVDIGTVPEKVEARLSTLIAAPPMPEAPETEPCKEAKSANGLLVEMVKKGFVGDLSAVQEAYERGKELYTGEDEKLRHKALYLAMAFRCGETSALEDLRTVIRRAQEYPSVRSECGRLLAVSLEQAGAYMDAADAYREAAAMSFDASTKARFQVSASSCLLKAGRGDEAVQTLMTFLPGSEAGSRSILYEGLASLLKERGEYELQALALEKALEERLSDREMLFSAAYSYGRAGLGQMAILHYQTHIDFHPDDHSALNNIAAEFEGLGMLVAAIESYSRAAELGNTLASANLARAYMRGGFRHDAERIIAEARIKPDVHPGIGDALVELDRSAEEDAAGRKSLLAAARSQQQFLSQFSEAYFALRPEASAFAGAWIQDVGQPPIQAVQEGREVHFEFSVGKVRHELKGKVCNAAVRGTHLVYKDGQILPSIRLAYGYLSRDGTEMRLMVANEKGHKDGLWSYLTLKRP
jgi:tetratricopeptide (TPR) repeat protein